MKLRDYIEHLVVLAATDPSIMDCETIYSVDEEGNGYKKVFYLPTIMKGEDVEGTNTDIPIEDGVMFVCIN